MPKKETPALPLKPMEQVSPSLSPAAAPQGRFRPMLQGTATNTLAKTSTKKTPPQVDEVTDLATINNDGLTIFIEGYSRLEVGLGTSTNKLLDLCTMYLTQQNDYRGKGKPATLVSIALEDYMEAMGIPHTKASKDKTRRKVKADLETLFSTSIEWSERSGGETKDFAKTRICHTVGIQRGHILIDFTPAFTQYLTGSYIMQFPMALLQISDKYSNSYYLGRKLSLHHGIDNNRKKGTHNIISVKALLESAPELPSFEQVRATDRAYTRRIIDPFERDLNAMQDILRWNYCNAGGAPLTEAQLAHFTYDVFIACYIQFEMDDFPVRDPSKLRKKH